MHFVIIGNGVAGTTAALTLRQREPKAEITMVSGESDYFFSLSRPAQVVGIGITSRDKWLELLKKAIQGASDE